MFRFSMSPKAIADKATLPDFLFFSVLSRADRPHVPHFPFFSAAIFAVSPVQACVLQHAACSAWIEYEETWDDWLCQGWVWVQTRFAPISSDIRTHQGNPSLPTPFASPDKFLAILGLFSWKSNFLACIARGMDQSS